MIYRHRRSRLPVVLTTILIAWIVVILIGWSVVTGRRHKPNVSSESVDVPNVGLIPAGRSSQVESSDDGLIPPGSNAVNVTQYERRDGSRVIVQEYEVVLPSGRIVKRHRRYVFPPGVATPGEWVEAVAESARPGMLERQKQAEAEAKAMTEEMNRAWKNGGFPVR